MASRREIRSRYRKSAEELVSRMTVREMISQLLHSSPAIPRLGIPAYNWWNEGLHGAARSGTATVFPQAIALASMFDRPFMEEIGNAVSSEQRAKYNAYSSHGDRGIYKGLTVWSPNINIFRDPRWGRGQETYGEDPCLTASLAVSFIKGLQGDGEVLKTASCIKHFIAHSGPEPLRHRFNATVSAKDLEETYLPAFRKCVMEGDVDGVMGAYSMIDGEPCCGTHLIEKTIRGEWGFDGVFISDCWAVRDFHEQHHVTRTPQESAALALRSGCDMNCGCTYSYLEKAYDMGLVSKEEIRKAAERVFQTRFSLGLFDEKTEYDGLSLDIVSSKEHRNASLKASRNSIVLLENRDGFLPLQNVGKVAVIGPNADSRSALWGNYHGTSMRYTTVLDGFRSILGDDRVLYSEGSHLVKAHVERLAEDDDRIAEAVSIAERCDVSVLCLGLDEAVEGEMHDDGNGGIAGDRKDLRLPECQRRLLEAVAAVGRPVVVVLLSGGAIDPEIGDKPAVKALLEAWYPGEYGGRAIAETILGINNPSAKLPVTFYRSSEKLMDYESYSMENRTYRYFRGEPLYPFGHGLSYTSFSYSGASFDEDANRVSVWVENTGDRDGDEITLAFVHCSSPDAPPNPVLAGFARTGLVSKERRLVSVELADDAFTLVSSDGVRYPAYGDWEIFVGSGQEGFCSNGIKIRHRKEKNR